MKLNNEEKISQWKQLHYDATDLKKENIDEAIEKLKQANKLGLEIFDTIGHLRLERLVQFLEKAGYKDKAIIENKNINNIRANFGKNRIKKQWEQIQDTKEFAPFININLGPTQTPCIHHKELVNKAFLINDDLWIDLVSQLYDWENCRCSIMALTKNQAIKSNLILIETYIK